MRAESIAISFRRDLPLAYIRPYAEYPDLREDWNGDVWVVYTQLDEAGQEMILLKQFHEFTQVDSFQVSTTSGYNDQPRLVSDAKGRVWGVWASKRDENWEMYWRALDWHVHGCGT